MEAPIDRGEIHQILGSRHLFLLILILHIQDPRILLRHGAGVLHLQLGARAEFLLGSLPPANPGLLGHDVVQVSLLLCLLHGRLADLVRVLADALQEVLEVGHGELLDLLAQPRDVVHHDLAEAAG